MCLMAMGRRTGLMLRRSGEFMSVLWEGVFFSLTSRPDLNGFSLVSEVI